MTQSKVFESMTLNVYMISRLKLRTLMFVFFTFIGEMGKSNNIKYMDKVIGIT